MLSAAMLDTVLGQHAAQCLYPFILSSLPFLEFVCLSLYSFLSHVTFTFCSLQCPEYCKYLLSLTPLSLPSHSSPLFTITPPQHLYFCPVSQTVFFCFFCLFTLSLSLCLSCLSVSLPSAAPSWCECLAFEETGVSLCVRNLTAQIT